MTIKEFKEKYSNTNKLYLREFAVLVDKTWPHFEDCEDYALVFNARQYLDSESKFVHSLQKHEIIR